jgi:predicted nicotinamide N-methyase
VRRGHDVVEQRVPVGEGSLVVTRPADPDALLAAAAEDAPYWAVVWPSAIALAEVLAVADVEGLHVLELGCGLGLPSLAAAVRGGRALATDAEPAALDYVRESARRLGTPIETLVVDVAAPPAALLDRAPFDLVLVADLLYEGPLASAVTDLLVRLLGPASEILVAYPWSEQGPPLMSRLLTALPQLELETTEHRIAGFRTDDRTAVSVLRGTLPG